MGTDDLFDVTDMTAVPDPTEMPFLVNTLESEATVVRRYTEYVLSVCGGNKSKTAKILGIDRRSVYRRLGLG